MRRQEKKFPKEKLMVLFIAFVMIFSVVGYMFGRNGSEEKLSYNDYKLVRKGSQWSIVVDNKEAVFDYFPVEVENINVSYDIIESIMNTLEVDTTYDINSSYSESIAYSQYEIALMLNEHFNIYVRNGFTTNNTFGLSVITCDDATDIVPVIYFKESDEVKVYSEGNCIIAEGRNDLDFVKIKDRLMYGVLGIIG